MTKVAVLLATYNGVGFLDQQINSILSQIDVSVDIFASDDISSDGTQSVLKRYESLYENVNIVSLGKKFNGASKNFFFLMSMVNCREYDYISLSDQDDIWFEDKLSNAIDIMRSGRYDGYSSNVIAFWPETERKKLIIKSLPQTKVDFWFEGPGPGCTQVLSRRSFEIFQKFVKKNYESLQNVDYHDWLIYAYFRYQNFSWVISPIAKMYYVQHSANQLGANKGLNALFSRYRMIRSGWIRRQVNLIYRLVSDSERDIITMGFMFKNFHILRRKKSYSFVLFTLYLLGIL